MQHRYLSLPLYLCNSSCKTCAKFDFCPHVMTRQNMLAYKKANPLALIRVPDDAPCIDFVVNKPSMYKEIKDHIFYSIIPSYLSQEVTCMMSTLNGMEHAIRFGPKEEYENYIEYYNLTEAINLIRLFFREYPPSIATPQSFHETEITINNTDLSITTYIPELNDFVMEKWEVLKSQGLLKSKREVLA